MSDSSPNYLYLTVAEVLEMQRQLIDEFGGIHGLRDKGLLEAAVFRPQNGYHDDLIHEAAALMESLATNHAFVDGNKRISFAAVDTFLRLNSYYLEVDHLEACDFINGSLAKREFRVGRIREWLEKHTHKLDRD